MGVGVGMGTIRYRGSQATMGVLDDQNPIEQGSSKILRPVKTTARVRIFICLDM
jgi:hypothetical protein